MNSGMGRRTVVAALLSALLPSGVLGRPAVGRKALLVLLETNPWLMVVGSDSPRFALYDDGLAIFRAGDGFKSVSLSDAEMSALLDRVDAPALVPLAKRYEVSSATDQPTEILAMFVEGKRSIIDIYGPLKSLDTGSSVPEKIMSAYRQLTTFDHPRAQSWLPDKIEVMIWPYDYAPQASIIWPKGWPGIDDANTVKRGDSYSLFVPSSHYAALTAFLRTRKEKGAVEIGGKKWAAAIRFPFPNEASWMREPS